MPEPWDIRLAKQSSSEIPCSFAVYVIRSRLGSRSSIDNNVVRTRLGWKIIFTASERYYYLLTNKVPIAGWDAVIGLLNPIN